VRRWRSCPRCRHRRDRASLRCSSSP
jgi:hypothetical protein